jgi:NADH:ubiquinone oxidoreductase subunit 2 (subunit N)
MLAILALLINFSSPREKEATLKYFLIQALASSILLSTALFAATLQQGISNSSAASFLIFFRLLIKIGAAPFHLWLPQVVEGLS